MNAVRTLMEQQIPAHETAHQWWGDLITWRTYRDQWVSEGLAEYCSLLMLEEKNPAGFQEVLEKYRRELVEKNKDGSVPKDAGPVTLGSRLLSSRFPAGYEAIGYGRGTWLFHMLRTMLRDAAGPETARSRRASDEPFIRGLHQLRERYAGKAVGTREMLEVFSEELPPALRYEGKASLDWFLEGWVNGTALPRLELQDVKFSPTATAVMVTGTILQKDAPDSLVTSVPIYAAGAGRTLQLLGRVFADGPESSFRLSAPVRTHKVVLDPYGTILTSPK
jgi:aminopeptidase N